MIDWYHHFVILPQFKIVMVPSNLATPCKVRYGFHWDFHSSTISFGKLLLMKYWHIRWKYRINTSRNLEFAEFPESSDIVEDGQSFPRRYHSPIVWRKCRSPSLVRHCAFPCLLSHLLLDTKPVTRVMFQLKLARNVIDMVKEKEYWNKHIFYV